MLRSAVWCMLFGFVCTIGTVVAQLDLRRHRGNSLDSRRVHTSYPDLDKLSPGLTEHELYKLLGVYGQYDPNQIPEEGGLIFLQHLRKAGGTTLCAVLGQNVPSNAMNDCFVHSTTRTGRKQSHRSLETNWDFAKLEDVMQENEVTLVSSEDGVFPQWIDFDDPTQLSFLKHWTFVTAMRFPLDRMVSFFTYEASPVFWGDSQTETCGSKDAFRQDPTKVIACLQQHQHKFWSRDVNGVNYYTRVFSGNRDDTLQSEDLIHAVKVLNNFAVVLVTEWFQEDCVVFKYMFGMDNVLAVPRNSQATIGQSKWNDPNPDKNRVTAVPKETKDKTKLPYSKQSHAKGMYSEEHYDYLMQLHAYDVQLYRVVQEMSRRRNQKWMRYDMFEGA